MKIEILPNAERDIQRAADFYASQDPGLGSYFTDCISTDIDSLQIYAGVHEIFLGLHRCVSKRFPFTIHYRVTGDTIIVFAVYDGRQDPAELESDLRSRLDTS